MSAFCRRFFIADKLSADETLKALLDNERRFYSKREYLDDETCVSPLDRVKMIEWMYMQVLLCIAKCKIERVTRLTFIS